MKKIIAILAAVVCLAGCTPATFIETPIPTPIPKEVSYTYNWDWQGERHVVYLKPGDEIVSGEVRITNASIYPMRISFEAIKPFMEGIFWPELETVFLSSNSEHYAGEIIVAAGSSETFTVKVSESKTTFADLTRVIIPPMVEDPLTLKVFTE
ncbi:MAG: hypothetical protein PHF44_01815 [Candidatus Pacebacteria bacterium]|nr:hypothetical protein [Candidatus Paceibacterota bacterium]